MRIIGAKFYLANQSGERFSGGREMVDADQMKEHIARHIKWDNSLKGSQINVDYLGRTAVLSGTVPNLAAHANAQRDAQSIPGVERVENRLEVKFNHNHPNKSDIDLKTDIQKVLGCISDIDDRQIKVTVQDGIVTLSGNIDSFWKKTRIEDLASSIEGVLEINNKLRVLPIEKAPDMVIKKDIISALERMEVKGLEKIKVEVAEGKVTLAGSVPTWSTSFDIEDTARFTTGVVEVKNFLTVE
jgi:osmotically-inducible protein OsmY